MRRYRARGRKRGREKPVNWWNLAPLFGVTVVAAIKAEELRAPIVALAALVGALMVGSGVLGYWQREKKRRLSLKSEFHQIEQMNGQEFREYLQAHFQKQGYEVQLVPGSTDSSVDLILMHGGISTVVQAERYKNQDCKRETMCIHYKEQAPRAKRK